MKKALDKLGPNGEYWIQEYSVKRKMINGKRQTYYCADGAIQAAFPDKLRHHLLRLEELLANAIPDAAKYSDKERTALRTIINFNDTPDRQFNEIKEVFLKVIDSKDCVPATEQA